MTNAVRIGGAGLAALLVAGSFFAGRVSVRPADRLLASAEGEAVATWKGGRLTRAELDALVAAEPPLARSRLQDVKQRETFVREVVQARLVAEEAVRRGMLTEAPLRQALIEHLAQALREREFSPEVIRDRVSEADVNKAFAERAQVFSQPEKVRLAHIFLDAKEGAPDRARMRTQALELLRGFRDRQNTDPMEFGRSAAVHSAEVATRSRGGDLGYLTREQLESRYGPRVAEAAWALASPGQVSELLETPDGFHLFQLAARSRARTAEFSDVRGALEEELVRGRQAEELRVFTSRLIEQAGLVLQAASTP